jgi:hypothetical protein
VGEEEIDSLSCFCADFEVPALFSAANAVPRSALTTRLLRSILLPTTSLMFADDLVAPLDNPIE